MGTLTLNLKSFIGQSIIEDSSGLKHHKGGEGPVHEMIRTISKVYTEEQMDRYSYKATDYNGQKETRIFTLSSYLQMIAHLENANIKLIEEEKSFQFIFVKDGEIYREHFNTHPNCTGDRQYTMFLDRFQYTILRYIKNDIIASCSFSGKDLLKFSNPIKREEGKPSEYYWVKDFTKKSWVIKELKEIQDHTFVIPALLKIKNK